MTSNLSNGLLKLHPVAHTQQPNSANPFLRCRNSKDSESHGYTEFYDKADNFLDENNFVIVEPGAETKVRKHIKVLTRSQSLFSEEETSSPLYTGSPMLQRVADSSLLARRVSRNQSPLIKLGSQSEENSTITSQQSSPTPRNSKFSESPQRSLHKKLTIVMEEQKSHSLQIELNSHDNLKGDASSVYGMTSEDQVTINSLHKGSEEELLSLKNDILNLI